MFEEAEKSYASSNIVIQILLFLVVFFIIYVIEGVISSVIAVPAMMDELVRQGYLESGQKLTMEKSIELSAELSTLPKIMIPTLICTVTGTLISIFYCRFIEMRSLSSMGIRKNHALAHYFTGFAAGAVMMTAIILLTVITGVNDIKLSANINVGLILLYFLGFLFQGMSEEFIFRGYLMNTIGGHHSTWSAVGISAAAFGLAHAFNPGFGAMPMINLVLYGVFASLYMICFDDIWGVCALHSVWNFTQGNIYGISVSGTGDSESVFRISSHSLPDFLTGGEFGIEGSIFTTIVLGAGIAAVLLKMKRSSTPVVREQE